MAKADDLYLMQLELQKRTKASMQAVDQGFQAIRDEERRQADQREKRAEQEAAATPEGRARAAWDAASDPRRWGSYEDEEG
ncbi:TolA protein, putative [Segniliparus rotundus DSM 44985]|uniref:TolA protein, putative n=1 Tax=Segniliparus rotundus (strain ATCC BAA-972 / CDC 1076 / CIP 108378 / DSM 44985 / JCM 13578) TaxID=640132 RepID=D6ZB14_SEGRD|nr:hypothetical protein [Segniliparus rotundus]ADG96773.1 TolA protein, putative [Segniliparus rotundus DSM 44985]